MLLALSLLAVLATADIFAPDPCFGECADGYTCQFGICIDDVYLEDCNCNSVEGCIPSFRPNVSGTCVVKPPLCSPACTGASHCALDHDDNSICVDSSVCDLTCGSPDEFCVYGACKACAVCPDVLPEVADLFARASIDISLFDASSLFNVTTINQFPNVMKSGALVQLTAQTTFDLANVSFSVASNDNPAGLYIQEGTAVFADVIHASIVEVAIVLGAGANFSINKLTLFNPNGKANLHFAFTPDDKRPSMITINQLYLGPGASLTVAGEGYFGVAYVDAHPASRINFEGGVAVAGEVLSGTLTANSLGGGKPFFQVLAFDTFATNVSITGPNGAAISVSGTFQIDVNAGVITPDLYILPNSSLIVTESSIITGAMNLYPSSSLVLDIANDAMAPFFGYLAYCPKGANIIYAVDEVFTEARSGLLFTFNENTDFTDFECQVSLVDGHGDSLLLTSVDERDLFVGSTMEDENASMINVPCKNQAIWGKNQLYFTTCDSPVWVTNPNGNAASTLSITTSLFSCLLAALLSLFLL